MVSCTFWSSIRYILQTWLLSTISSIQISTARITWRRNVVSTFPLLWSTVHWECVANTGKHQQGQHSTRSVRLPLARLGWWYWNRRLQICSSSHSKRRLRIWMDPICGAIRVACQHRELGAQGAWKAFEQFQAQGGNGIPGVTGCVKCSRYRKIHDTHGHIKAQETNKSRNNKHSLHSNSQIAISHAYT